MGIPDIRQLITLEFEVYGHVQGEVQTDSDHNPIIMIIFMCYK